MQVAGTTKFPQGNQRQLRCSAQRSNSTITRSNIIDPVATKQAQDLERGSIGQSVWNVLASSQSFASQLLSHFPRWPGSQPGETEQAEKVGLPACCGIPLLWNIQAITQKENWQSSIPQGCRILNDLDALSSLRRLCHAGAPGGL